MGFERDLMPFMAIQDLWVGHGPALVVLVDERFPVGADFACEAHRFRRCLLGFRGFLLHLARLSGFLSQREQRHHERERERNQHQFFHSGTPFGWSTLAKRYWSRPSLRSAPAMSGVVGCGFRDETSVLSCDASGQAPRRLGRFGPCSARIGSAHWRYRSDTQELRRYRGSWVIRGLRG